MSGSRGQPAAPTCSRLCGREGRVIRCAWPRGPACQAPFTASALGALLYPGPQGPQRPEARPELCSRRPTTQAPERTPSIHLGLPLPLVVALLCGSHSGIFRTPRNGAQSWGSHARRHQLGRQGQQDSLPRGRGFSRLLLAPCWFGGGESFWPCPSAGLAPFPCPRCLASDVHPAGSDAVQTALGTSPLLSGPASSCVKLAAMTPAAVFPQPFGAGH